MYKYLVSILLLAGCGSVGRNLSEAGKCVNSGEECHAKGPQGETGEQGVPGREGSAGSTGGKGPQGTSGPQGTQGNTGATGPGGAPGTNGTNGTDGEDCTVNQLNNGAEIVCGDDTVAIILNGVAGTNGTNGTNGQDGADGEDGADAPPTAYSVTEMYDPCGDQSGFDEVLLHLANGQWVAHYAGGGNLQFLTVLTPGNYVTTDPTPCHFTITNSMTITNEYL